MLLLLSTTAQGKKTLSGFALIGFPATFFPAGATILCNFKIAPFF